MPFAVVTVETDWGDKIELALPLDVPSRELARKIIHDLGRTLWTNETVDFFIDTGRADKLIPSSTMLGSLGMKDGQRLRIKRVPKGSDKGRRKAHAYLKTRAGEMLPLEVDYVIIGRKDLEHEIPIDLDMARHDPGNAVSRRHACISREGENHFLLELGSTNGTSLNGTDIAPGRKMLLKDGDKIDFGRGLPVTFLVAEGGA
jgi:hypothetical protein